MTAGSAAAARGELGRQNAASIIGDVEARRATARIYFETEVGGGQVDMVEGIIVDAFVDNLIGRPALFSLLGANEGHFEVREEALEARPPLIESVAELLRARDERVTEWKRLCERAPPLSAMVTLAPAGEEALRDSAMPGSQRSVLALIDGTRSVSEVLDQSGLDAVHALRILLEARQSSLVADATAKQSLVPAPVVAIGAPRTTEEHTESRRVTGQPLGSLRRHTVVGLGVPEVIKPKGVEPSRVIQVGGGSLSVPIPIPPRERGRTTAPPPVVTEAKTPVNSTRRLGSRRYVGRYELLSRIGYGGMGSVYLGRLTSEGGFRRLFALKVLRSHLAQDGEAARKFLEEARLSGHVHHPNVVSVLDAGLEDGQPYLVMDYIEGASLKRLLSQYPNARPPELIVPIALDALTGLHAAHTLVGEDGRPLQIVHCDVSPENLLVGIDGVCRLTDFGVARHVTTTRDRTGVAHGKPAYLSPEQVLGARVDQRADVFAMGVVLYNALTGVRLFDAPTTDETLRLVCSGPIAPPSSVGLRPPPSLDFVCMRALEREPNRRFESAEEMMTLLRRVALHEDLLSPPSRVAAWVKEAVNQELSQRRLALLDAARRPQGAQVAPPSIRPAPAPAGPRKADGVPRSNPPPESGTQNDSDAPSQTILLQVGPSRRQWALLAASLLAALVLLATVLFPRVVSSFFHLKTDGASGADLPAPSASGSSDAFPSTSGTALAPPVPSASSDPAPANP